MTSKAVKICIAFSLVVLFLSSLCVQPKCLGEGQQGGGLNERNPRDCCPGLNKLDYGAVGDESGRCVPALDAGYICTKCGDKKCKTGESYCNCPQDCPVPCSARNNGCDYETGWITYDCSREGGKFVLDYCDEYCQPIGACISADGTCGNKACESGEDSSCPQDCDRCKTFSCAGNISDEDIDEVSIGYCNGIEGSRITCPEGYGSSLSTSPEGYRLCCVPS